MKRILLIVGGGIAAYKACELIRLARKAGIAVRCVLTASGAHFVTPMTLAALSESQVFTSLWDLKDEAEMGHIQRSEEHTSELQSLMRISYAVFCLKKKTNTP